MIPDRFRDRILVHATAVYSIKGYPLMLAIQGAPGVGKSYQTFEVLRTAGFAVIRESATKFQGKHEGDGNRLIMAEYQRAIETARDPACASPAILIEDFDLSTAVQKEGVTYTVNSDLLNGFLMNLTDDVAMEFPDDPIRIPIFLTGNDFSLLYGPLKRHGRLDVFTWDPSTDDVHAILTDLFMGLVDEPSDGAAAVLGELGMPTIASLKFALDRIRADWNFRQIVQSPEAHRMGRAKLQDVQFSPMEGMGVETFVELLCSEYWAIETPSNHLAERKER